MTRVYKLTDQDGYTRRNQPNETLWGPNVTHEAKGTGGLCTSGCIHAYTSPELAALLNPIHGNIVEPVLWVGEMDITDKDGLKVGGKRLTTLRKSKLPSFTSHQRAIFAVLCADAVLEMHKGAFSGRALEKINEWHQWKRAFLEGRPGAARAAARAAYAADVAYADAAADAADAAYADAAADAAYAARAARAAARAAYAADVAYAARAAADAAYAARADAAGDSLNLVAIAKRALRYDD